MLFMLLASEFDNLKFVLKLVGPMLVILRSLGAAGAAPRKMNH